MSTMPPTLTLAAIEAARARLAGVIEQTPCALSRTLSTMTVTGGPDGPTLPAASTARAVNVCGPSGSELVE